MRFILALALIGLLVFLTGCSGRPGEADRRPLTERQQDSTLAETRLPGAGAIKTSYALSDSAAARADRLEQLPR